MNGAHALLATLRANGVTTCFANPGTSEMHFVAGLDDFPEIHAVLCLFEGVATGAADGFARVSGSPASTLLHLGPGLANGWANLHNARRARSPIVNIVGDHATYHAKLDAPLQSDIGSLASALEGWQRRSGQPSDLSTDVADAIAAANGPPGQVATLILPADISWGEVPNAPTAWPLATRRSLAAPDANVLDYAGSCLRTKRTALFLGGTALTVEQLDLAQRLGDATASKVLMETFPAIMDRGARVADPERLVYLSEFAESQLRDVDVLLLVGAVEPVGFFAYPDLPSRLVSESCEVVPVAPPGTDTLAALASLVELLGAPARVVVDGDAPLAPTGALDRQTFAQAVGATMPDGLIVADEANTSGISLFAATQFAAPHRWMTLTGGSIGLGLPLAVGAAIASGQRVLALESDGSMMYTLQALWTMARESLDVTVVALNNQSYAILDFERKRVGAVGDGASSEQLLELNNPELDLCALASAQGVPALRVRDAEALVSALNRSYATSGPMFIEVVLSRGLG